jgi:hypothetical protein
MKNILKRIPGILIAAFGIFLLTAYSFGLASGGLAAGIPVLVIGLLVVSCSLEKPGPIQESDGAISGKRLAAFLLIGGVFAILFKFGFDGLTLWPAVIMIVMLIVVTLIFGLATIIDLKSILQLVKGGGSSPDQ